MRTLREMLDEMVKCETSDQAQNLIQREVDELVESHPSYLREEARDMVMKNIGYATGYLDREQAGRLLRLFGTRHPYMGAIEDWPTTPEATLRMGMQLAQRKLQEGAKA